MVLSAYMPSRQFTHAENMCVMWFILDNNNNTRKSCADDTDFMSMMPSLNSIMSVTGLTC